MGWGFIEKVGKGIFQTTAKSVEFVTDIFQEALTDEDEFEGDTIADTIWGSWNDNILGEGGAMEGAIGPEGIGGTLIGAIPESVRQPMKSVITPVFDTFDYLYQNIVDDPLSAAVLVLDGALSSDGEGWDTMFDGDTWRRAFDIAETRSLGQSIALAALAGNPYDDAEVLEAKQSGLFNLFSGSIDLFANIALDPLAWAGKPVMLASKFARNGRWVAGVDAGRTFRNPLNLATGADEFVKTNRFKRFGDRIDGIAKELDEGLPTRLGEGPLSRADLDLVDELAGKVYKEFQNTPGMTPELAYALSRYTGESRSIVARLAMGDPKAQQLIRESATQWVNASQEGGEFSRLSKMYDELDELKSRRMDEGYDIVPDTQTRDIAIFNKDTEIALLENKIAEGVNALPSELPYLDALNIRQLEIQRLSKFADEVEDVAGANARMAAMNESPDLVAAATDQLLYQVLGGDNIGALAKPLSISKIGNLGYGVATFVSNVPYLGRAASYTGRKLTVFSERVPQQLINWDDANQSFNQFERMLRDAERVKYKGTSLFDKTGTNAEQLLGEWTRLGQDGRKVLFERTIKELNEGVVNIYGDKVLRGLGDTEKAEIMRFSLQKIKGNLDSAQGTLRAQSTTARVYGNGSLSFKYADEAGDLVQRHMENFTPQQLAQSSLVPRYDLISNLFHKGPVKGAIGDSQKVMNEFMGVWKKSVLLRPAWPMRVVSDELARSAALLGGIETLRGAMAGFTDLRAKWFARSGEDVMTPALARMREELAEKGVKDVDLMDQGQLYERYVTVVADGSQDAVTKLVRKTISEEYGKKRIIKRTGALSAVGMWAMGPAGLAAAGLYGLYARKSMRLLAIREVGQNFAYGLRDVARIQLADEIEELTRRSKDPTDALTLDQASRQTEDLRKAAELLELQSKTLLGNRRVRNDRSLTPDRRQRESLKRERRELDRIYGRVDEAERSAALVNFDRVGQLMNDARVGGYYMGGYKFANEFGDTPFDVQMNKRALSSNASNRALMNSTNQQAKAALERNLQQRVRVAYDDYANNPQSLTFSKSYDDTVNKQWKPENAPNTFPGDEWGNEFQDFTRQFWAGHSDESIVRWVESRKADRLREAMPMHTLSRQNIEHWVQGVRSEIDTILPRIDVDGVDIFAAPRKKLAEGKDISWTEDVVPLIKKHTQAGVPVAQRNVMAGIEEIRLMQNQAFPNFGRISGSSEIIQGIEAAGVFKKATKGIDNIMQAWGTDTVDNLSRSTVFAGVYRREVARRVQAFRNADGTYTLTRARLKSIEDGARAQGIKETRSLLYDLAERGRFEEMVGTVMPFYGAWQEVVTNWAGLAVKNPVFVARGIRYFRALEGEDEEGNKRFMWRFPEELLTAELAGQKVFGKLGELGFTSLKLNPTSLSMISAGIPGFGPVVTSLASEAVIRNPGLQETLDWMLPYGASEGTNMLGRMAQQVEPTFVRRIAGAYFDTAERQKMLAQVSIDLAINYVENGNKIITEEMMNNFSKEAERRTEDLLKVRALAGLAIPMSFSLQSPYHDVIEGYRKRVEEEGFDEANDWLLNEKGEEFFALTARRTMIRGVASATLEGEEKYREHQEFADKHPLLKDFIIGKVGADDVQFEFNYAVYKTEIAEGRRERATPEEILRKPQENMGWTKWAQVRDVVYEELDRRGQQNGSASLRANSNNDLRNILEAAKSEIRVEHPLWWQAYNAARDPLEMAKTVQGFREVIVSEDFAYRPEMPQLEEYLEAREAIEQELDRRWKASGDVDNASLKNRNNQDLEDLWDAIRVSLRNNPQFSAIFDRYFESDNIERNTWMVNS